MNIYIIRHGETEYNAKGIVQGKGVNSSLNQKGIDQRNAFFEQYKDMPFDLVITSSLKRTLETAAPFIEKGVPHEISPLIDEISWGIYEGKKASENLRKDYVGLISYWGNGDYEKSIPEGESASDMGNRLGLFVEELSKKKHENILITTHGGALAFLMAILQKEPLSAMAGYKHSNTGLCRFEYKNHNFELITHDDVSHLKNIKALEV
jgi:phosphoserine phosphatase